MKELKVIERIYNPHLRKSLDDPLITVLIGPRQSGKTTSINSLYDKYSPRLKIIISGSSSLELLDRTAETLAGRVQILRIYPFSMSEASLYEEIGGFESAGPLYKS